MKVTVLGASGNAGTQIVKELASRGHQVTGVARNPDRIPSADIITPVQGDVTQPDGLTPHITGSEAVISALRFSDANAEVITSLVKSAGVKRLLVVGGAGSLEIEPGLRLVDSPDFPEEYKPEARHGVAFLEDLKQEKDLDWTFISPSIFFEDGERTDSYRTGTDQPLFDDGGKSSISFQDFAVAMADEVEMPEHIRQRFTVGY